MRVQVVPAASRLRPPLRHAGEDADPCAHVRAPLRVVRRPGEERLREAQHPLQIGRVELVDRLAEPAGLAADLVQREQADVAVESGVLDALRHDGAGCLLESRHELFVTTLLEQEDAAKVVREVAASGARSASSTRSLTARRTCCRPGAMRVRLTPARRAAAEPPDLRLKRRPRLLEFASRQPRGRSWSHRRAPSGGLAGRVDEELLNVVLRTRNRSSPGPASRVAVHLLEDLLDPDSLGPAVAQPREIASGIREPVDVVDAEAVDEPFADELQHDLCVISNTSGSSPTNTGELVDVEEAALASGLLVEVEVAPALRRISPERVLLA